MRYPAIREAGDYPHRRTLSHLPAKADAGQAGHRPAYLLPLV